MSTTLSTINTLINDRRRDSGSNSIDIAAGGFRAVTSTMDLMKQMHDWVFTLTKATVVFHKGITWYATEDDFKCINDLRVAKPTSNPTEFDFVSSNNFDSTILKPLRFAVAVQDREQYLRIESNGDKQTIQALTSVDSNGTWTAGGHASNVTTDSYESFDLNASVNFDFSGTVGTLTNDDMTAIDLSRMVDRSKQYLNVYLPTVTSLTSVAVKIGSDSSNYYSDTATTNYLGEALVVGWNKLEFDVWDTVTSSPDAENIDYIQLTFTYSGTTTDTDFRVENLFCSEDTDLDLIYYSTNMVYDVSGTEEVANFNDATATTDYPLWSGDQWDFVTESFVDATLEIIFWMTGETDDRQVAEQRRLQILTDLKRRLPSKKRRQRTNITVNV